MDKDKEYTLFDYLKWRGDLDFNQSEVNVLDLLVLSQIVMFNLSRLELSEGETLKRAYKLYSEKYGKEKLGLIIPDEELVLFKKARHSNRFKNIKILDSQSIISEEKEEQMTASTFLLDDTICVAYSGTDDTVVGWKENFYLIYKDVVEAQVDACKYLKEMMDRYPDNKFYVLGHSKGGNLALYASIKIPQEYQKRIIKTYSFDGPGLNKKLSMEATSEPIFERIVSIIPQSSCVGRLFMHPEATLIIKSSNKRIYQHDVFSWLVDVKDFIYLDELDKEAIELDEHIKSILNSMSDKEKEKLANNAFLILENAGIKRLLDVEAKSKQILEAYFKLSREERNYVFVPFYKLYKNKLARMSLFDTFKGYLDERKKSKKKRKADEEDRSN